MKKGEVEYSRTFNLGQYESERIGLRVELDESEDLDQAFKTIKAQLHKEGRVLEVDVDIVKDKFSDEWVERLDFSVEGKYFIAKPKPYLNGDQFRELASIIKDLAQATKPTH